MNDLEALKKDSNSVLDALYSTALEIFEKCGESDDFCVQTVGECVVFGKWNRLKWSARHGWSVLESRGDFSKKFNALKEKGEIYGIEPK